MSKSLVIGTVVAVVGLFALGGFLLWQMTLGGEESLDSSTGVEGITPEEAGRVVPLQNKIDLEADITNGGVLLTWEASNGGSWMYYDIYEREPDTVGWGSLIERIEVSESQNRYSYTVRGRISGHEYEYQIIGIKVSNGYEIKDNASKSVEVIYP